MKKIVLAVCAALTTITITAQNPVGSHVQNYDFMINLAHFKGHAMGGFGGVLKNQSIGVASSSGKLYIHSAGASTTSWRSAAQDDFLESMAAAAQAVHNYFKQEGKDIIYINVMNRLSVDCDCDGHPASPEMNDIGILASTDPVALDKACLDLVFNYNSQGLYAEALTEYRENAVPELKDFPQNIGDYDIILLGYCNWWASIPAPVRTFLKRADLGGKVIVPFCSMGGGRFGQTISAIAKLAPESVILQGLDVMYSSYDRNRIRTWLDNIKAYQQTAGIGSVRAKTSDSGPVYSLDGRKVLTDATGHDKLPNGIYIVNGEKRIIK